MSEPTYLPSCAIALSMRDVPHSGPCVLVPGLARFAPHLREVCAMLPVTDINGALFESLEAGLPTDPNPSDLRTADVAAGLFLTDPFLNIADAARRLAAAGLGTVANYPTVQVLDGPSAAGLASVGHSFVQECEGLSAFAARGFAIMGYAASRPAAQALLALGCTRLVLLSSAPVTEVAADCAGRAELFRHAPAGAD